ncbi:hypothetical protein V6667_02960 [Neisseria leonii]|uniref:hypothetical protein n=1 Tax=Neisseria leonii TaxID=2995413 RepID=UPI0030D480A8
MKNKFTALIIATFVATPVMAQNFENQVFANQNVKAVELSQAEMQETQGAWVQVVYHGGGALIGGYAGGYGYLAAGGKDPKGFLAAVAGGAAGGAISPVTSFKGAAFAAGSGLVGSWVNTQMSK